MPLLPESFNQFKLVHVTHNTEIKLSRKEVEGSDSSNEDDFDIPLQSSSTHYISISGMIYLFRVVQHIT